MAFEYILAEKQSGIGIITLNRPAKLNAMNHDLMQEVHLALTDFENDAEIRVLVMTGAGEKAFCAGADIHEEAEISSASTITTDDLSRWRGKADNTWHVANYKKPTICALNGLAYGGGAYLAAAFDIRIGCQKSDFRFVGVKAGMVGGTWSLPQIIGFPMTKELLFSGRVVLAEEVYRIGLMNHIVFPAEVMPVSLALAREIAGNYQPCVMGIKEILNGNIGLGLPEMHDNERQTVVKKVPIPNPKDSFASFLNTHKKE
jgi:enoyl-CoA hydratase